MLLSIAISDQFDFVLSSTGLSLLPLFLTDICTVYFLFAKKFDIKVLNLRVLTLAGKFFLCIYDRALALSNDFGGFPDLLMSK